MIKYTGVSISPPAWARHAILLFFILCTLAVNAQKKITGKVTEDGTSQPVFGASIQVKGTTRGAITDEKGQFSLSVNPGDKLLVSSMEFESQEVTVGAENTIHIVLKKSTAGLNEVVIIGYGTVKKKDLTGSIATLKGGDIKTEGASNVSRALQGKLAGVTVEAAGGDPGAGMRILVRGVGTFNNANPLYLVDGVQVNNINNIAPGDIESMDVLKDASAAAIYGSRAANGVVLVTTKSGKNGPPVIQFNANFGSQKLIKKYDVLNAQEWATVSNMAHDNAGLARLDIAANPNQLGAGTDWQDAIYRTAMMQQYNLSVSGGTEHTRYSFSGQYNDQDGIVDVTGYKRYGIREKTETTKGRLKVGQSLILTRENWTKMPGGWGGQGGNPVGSAVKMIPVFNIYDENAIGGYSGASGPVVNVANPVAQLHLEDITTNVTSIIANAFAELTILPELKYKFNLGYTDAFISHKDYTRRYEVGGLFANPTNNLAQASNRYNLVMAENTLNYAKDFGKHSFQALAGYAYQKYVRDSSASAKNDLADGISELDNGAIISAVSGNKLVSTLVSLLGRVIYSYDNRYLLTASFRRDGSSRFAPAYRYGNFPSIAAGWNISNEKFWSLSPASVSMLKLRGSYGILGNQEFDDYGYAAVINSNINYVNGNQSKWFGAIQTTYASPYLKWENTETVDVGIDAAFLHDKLTLTADYFRKNTTDLLLKVPIPGSAGSAADPFVNGGNILNKGVEMGIGYNDKVGAVSYSVRGTFSSIKNKVLALGTGTQQIAGGQPTHHGADATLTQAGGEIAAFYLIKSLGIFQSQEEIDAYKGKDGQLIQPSAKPGDIKFFDANGDGTISNADRLDMGSSFPSFEYGLGINLNAYNFDLNLFLQGTQGNKIYNGLRQDLEGMNLEYNYARTTLNAWTPTNTNTDMPRAVIDDPNFNARTSSRFLENGSYFRFKTLQLGYTVPTRLLERAKISSLRAYLSADNLFTITKYKGFNPDIGRSGSILDRGVDFGHVSYPLARTLSVGIQLSL
ncbi:TonB-linked outer membrane protein, SusC/RagA family [Chitinophaga jiangningensis]|uniref:TonB-linked outer membrane protein, SusC/RagA family n=1 Tax=Chitinophaga jiangningensis TaxID=1419482 RepID=A0A1M7IN55_9BACT|nr:TonB-dependent receptor [Chitinophaga jiangningensis]SHM42109.1 TonB-linked outer membrane protein, SusC/RagA family [Chitinophaga jiangningensis]